MSVSPKSNQQSTQQADAPSQAASTQNQDSNGGNGGNTSYGGNNNPSDVGSSIGSSINSSGDAVQRVKVLTVTTWTPTLFSFTVSRPAAFRFSAGQFVRLGVNPSRLAYHRNNRDHQVNQGNQDLAQQPVPDEDIFRAYSIVSSPYDDSIEFFSIVIADGAFTSQLQHLQRGDELLLTMTPFGFLTLARYQAPMPKDLWLLATGTGVAPFLSMLQDMQTWERYEHIILAYSARSQSELAYVDKIHSLSADFASLVQHPAKFTFLPIVTRESMDGALNKRLPALLTSGELETAANQRLTVDSTHIMLCGNPQMVDDTKETLKTLGLTMNRSGVGNIAVENYW